MYEEIELTKEKPTEQDYYFVIGEKNIKACLYWNGKDFEKGGRDFNNKINLKR